MTYDQVLRALTLYKTKLMEHRAELVEVPHDCCPATTKEALNHALTMIEKMQSFYALNHWQWFLQELGIPMRWILGKKWEKLMRWLGFLQAILWGVGIFTLNELKDHNR